MKRVLVIRLSSLGDVALTSPVFRNIQAAWPEARVTALVKPAFRPLLEGRPGVDEVMTWKGFFPTLFEIKARGFTHLLDLHGTFRSFCLRRLSGVPNQNHYRKAALARRLFVWFGRRGPALEKHVLDRYLESLSAWAIPVKYRLPELGRISSAPSCAPPEGPAAQNILVLQTAFLGDATLTLPLVQALRKRFPSSRLSVLCRRGLAEIFHGAADEILEDDKRQTHRGLRGLWRLTRELKGRKFDLAIIPHRSFRSALLAWGAGVPLRVGFENSAGRFLLTRRVPFSWLMHDLERNLSLLSPLGPALDPEIPAAPAAPVWGAGSPAAPPPKLQPRLQAVGRDGRRPLIGIHPGSVWPTKRWLPGRYSELTARLCRELKAQVVLVGDGADRTLTETIAAGSQAGRDCWNWAGETTLSELVELMRELSLFISNDSGPMHIATAAGVPTLAIFGPTTRELGFFPYGPGHRVLEKNLGCRPCGLHGRRACPEGHFLCMRLITTEEVYQTATAMLQQAQTKPTGEGVRPSADARKCRLDTPLENDPHRNAGGTRPTEPTGEEVPPPKSVGTRPTKPSGEEVPPPNAGRTRPTEPTGEEVPPPNAVRKRP